jgi:hypothetical protein
VAFAKRRAGLEWEEGLLCEAQRAGVHRRLGFASFGEYVERHFGHNRRLVKEKLRVALALERLPQTSEALRSGEVNWSAVRELTRVVAAETESAWLDAARGRTARQVEEMVPGRAPGDLPSAPADPKLRKYRIHLELCAETRAVLVEALAALRGDALDVAAGSGHVGTRWRGAPHRAGNCRDGDVRCTGYRRFGSNPRGLIIHHISGTPPMRAVFGAWGKTTQTKASEQVFRSTSGNEPSPPSFQHAWDAKVHPTGRCDESRTHVGVRERRKRFLRRFGAK